MVNCKCRVSIPLWLWPSVPSTESEKTKPICTKVSISALAGDGYGSTPRCDLRENKANLGQFQDRSERFVPDQAKNLVIAGRLLRLRLSMTKQRTAHRQEKQEYRQLFCGPWRPEAIYYRPRELADVNPGWFEIW